MIVCPNCAKSNQDHYKFCLACGSKLQLPSAQAHVPSPPPLGRPAPSPMPPVGGPPKVHSSSPTASPADEADDDASTAPTASPPAHATPTAAPAQPRSPASVPPAPMIAAPPSFGAAPHSRPAAAPPGGASVQSQDRSCPSCSMVNPAGFRYCGRCGHPLETPPARAPEDMGTAQTMFVGNVNEGLAAIEHDDEDEATLSKPFGISNLAQDPPNLGGSGQPASTSQSRAKLVMLGTDGQPVGERILAVGETLEIGRTAGPPWDDDAYLDPKHGALTLVDEGVQVVDFDSVNGFFVKLHGRMEIQNGDRFRVGQELLRYEDLPEPTPTNDGTERMGSPNPGYWGRLCVLVDPQRASMAYPIEDEGVTIGREQGEITFPQDGYVSGRHCRLMGDDEGIYIEDLGSSNGTYMRVRDGQTLPYGSLVLIGQKLFQIERLA